MPSPVSSTAKAEARGPAEAQAEAEAEARARAQAQALGLTLPRVLVVSRRTVRKNKFVDFVGELSVCHSTHAPTVTPALKQWQMLQLQV